MLNAAGPGGRTPLFEAVYAGHDRILRRVAALQLQSLWIKPTAAVS